MSSLKLSWIYWHVIKSKRVEILIERIEYCFAIGWLEIACAGSSSFQKPQRLEKFVFFWIQVKTRRCIVIIIYAQDWYDDVISALITLQPFNFFDFSYVPPPPSNLCCSNSSFCFILSFIPYQHEHRQHRHHHHHRHEFLWYMMCQGMLNINYSAGKASNPNKT